MNIITGDNMEGIFAENLIDVLDKELDGSVLSVLSNATIYIITGDDDKISLDIVIDLVKEGMESKASSFISDLKHDKDVSTCIRGKDGNVQFMIVKVDVDAGKKHYAVPIEVMVLKIVHVLKEVGALEVLSKAQLRGMMKRVVSSMTGRMDSKVIVERIPGYYS